MNTNRASGRRLPKLERLILDSDVNARVKQYLDAIGFDVVLATQVDVNVRRDVEILRWARKHRRFMVCHDKHRDGQTKFEMFQEIYEHGGKLIRIGGTPNQHPVTSVGHILAHRHKWLEFFEEYKHGIVVVHRTGMKETPRELLQRHYQRRLITDPTPALEKRLVRKPRTITHRSRPKPEAQMELKLDTAAS